MATKTEQRRNALRLQLTDSAEAAIAKGGLGAIRARDLAADVGCAVGAIYNAVGDLHDLILDVNGRTFKRLGRVVATSVEGREADSPTDRLVALSLAYLAFARDNTNLWRALFDVEMRSDSDVPEWYLSELQALFAYIAVPVAEIFPDSSKRDLELTTRALFSSVHGIVLLGLEQRISGVPLDEIERMIALTLRNITKNK